MALKVGELYALFTLDSSGVNTALDGISTKLTTLGNEFIQAGTLWSNAITVPIKNALGDALETGMDFTAAMDSAASKMKGIDLKTDEGQAAYQELEAKALEVAKNSVYTSEQVAGAYEKMAMAGWEYRSMLGALEPIMDLAAASGEGVVGVSDIVTDAMTAFGLTFEHAGKDVQAFNKDVRHFTDVLAAAATSSNTDIGMMGESFKYAGNMAGSMGYSIDDVAIALGLMANRGVKASQAGTGLRALWKNLIDPPKDAAIAISELGLTLDDGDGNMLSFMELMQEMREKFGDGGSLISLDAIKTIDELTDDFYKNNDAAKKYFDTYEKLYDKYGSVEAAEANMDPGIVEAYQKEYAKLAESINEVLGASELLPDQLKLLQYATAIGGVRGMSALLSIINASEEEFQGLTDAVYGSEGRTHEMKESMLDNAMGDLEMFKSSVDILKVSIEELVDDQLRSLLQTATEIIDKFISMDDETKMTILKMAGLAAAIGPALVGFGALLKILPALGTAFSFITTPLGLVTVLLGGLALAAMDSDGKISKAFGEMKEAFGLDGLEFNPQEMLEGINVEQMLDGLLGSVTELANSEAVQGFMKRLGEGLVGALGALGDIVGDLIGYILSPEGALKIFDAGISLAKLLLSGIGYAIEGAANFIDRIVSGILNGLGLINKEAMKNELEVGDLLSETISESITDSSGNVQHTAETAFATILAAFAAGQSDAFEDMISDTGIESIYDYIQNYLYWNEVPGNAFDMQKLFENAFAESDLDFGPILKNLPENFWQTAYDAITGNANQGEGKPLLDLLLQMMVGSGVSSAVNQELQDKDAAFAAAVDEAGLPKTSKALTNAMDGASKEATEAMQKTFADEKAPVTTAAAEYSDEAVKVFLLTMSAENGTLIAQGFTGAITAEIYVQKESMLIASSEAAEVVKLTFSNILTEETGSGIGLNFSLGIAAGITAGESAVIEAAKAVANAALTAATGTLDINSPSKVAEDEVGLMYGKGLALGILDSMPTVISASERLADVLNSQMYLGAGRSDGFAPGLRQPAYAGGYGSSTVNSPTYVHNHYMNIEHYYQKSAEDVDYLADKILVRNRRDQSGRGM